MYDAPLDAWYVWLGVSAVSLAVAGVVFSFPAHAPPDAWAVADGIDAIAARPGQGTATVPVDATLLKLGSGQISLRGPGGVSHATLAYGPVTPVGDGRLRAVLAGKPPQDVFETPAEFGRAVRNYRGMEPTWRPAPERLRVRRVSWGDVDATLVG